MGSTQRFRATVRGVFQIAGPSCAVVLENNFAGTVRPGQVVDLGGQAARVERVEFLDSISEGKSWLAIIVDASLSAIAEGQIGKEIFEFNA